MAGNTVNGSGRNEESGFNLIGLVVLITIMGIALATVAVVWTTQVRRSQESELEYRLGKIRHGIKKYKILYKETAPSLEVMAEKKLVRPHCLIDPITGENWRIEYDNKSEISNVRCGSDKLSFKLVGGKKVPYSEW